MSVTARIEATLQSLASSRRPKAIYLSPDDWTAFMATKPPTIRTMWGNNPPQERIDPAFNGVPVRETDSATSRLYDNTSAGRVIK